MTRDGIVRLGEKLPACVIAMEACCGAHHLGRVLRDQGHEVRLMPPEYVQPYVRAGERGIGSELELRPPPAPYCQKAGLQ
jgi:transposase